MYGLKLRILYFNFAGAGSIKTRASEEVKCNRSVSVLAGGIDPNCAQGAQVLLLEGPRQCGKTTLARQIAGGGEGTIYRTLDDQTLLNSAIEDPQSFVAHGNELMIIDEVQRAPLLLPAVKKDVDENETPGRFILTGSANFQSLPKVNESMAGRVRKVRLRPLSEGELENAQPQFLARIFAGDVKGLPASNLNKDDYLTRALRGGFPEVVQLENDRQRRLLHKDYLQALIDCDLRDIANIRLVIEIYGCISYRRFARADPWDTRVLYQSR